MHENLMLIFGKSWTGKTARLLHELRGERRVVLVDPKCGQLARLRGWLHVWPVYDSENCCWTAGDLPDMLRDLRSGPFYLAVHFRSFYQQNLDLLCALLLHVKRLTLAVDELSLFAPPGPSLALPPNLTSVAISGSHEAIRFVGTAQRPSGVHHIIRSQANRMLFFRLDEKNDRLCAENYLAPDFMSQLPSLPDYVCVDWRDGGPVFVDWSQVGKLADLLPADRV